MSRNKEEKQGLLIAATQQELGDHRDQLCRQTQQISPLVKPPATTDAVDSLHISLAFAPQVFTVANVSHLSVSLQPPPILSKDQLAPEASSGLWLHGCKMPA